MNKLLVTSALPYANGDIHIGHLVEYIQSDIWVRYWKQRGRDAIHICADDAHGTAVMLRAEKEGIMPELLIERVRQEHIRDFARFDVVFDHYGSTHSADNKELSLLVYEKLQKGGHIEERAIEQYYCPKCAFFLPDRYIRGICPYCGAADQYGDVCEACSKIYTPGDLREPHCAHCGSAPERRHAQHLFFRLRAFESLLPTWVREHAPAEVANKMEEWFHEGLRDWDITRDAPYFGFEIPDRDAQYFYVWLDAPIGYMAATREWCRQNGKDFDSYWKLDAEADVYHFLGKDISTFHAIFWPAMLMGAGLRTPTGLCVHGFLTVNGEKMSKSRGTFITADTYLRHLDPQYLRYYYAAKLDARVEDIDLHLEDFVNRVNSELVGKIANIPSRTLALLQRCGGCLGTVDAEGQALISAQVAQRDRVAAYYEERDYARVTRALVEIASDINCYLDAQAPWRLTESDPEQARDICTSALNAYKVLATLIQPIVPGYGEQMAAVLGLESLPWEEAGRIVENCLVQPYVHLAERMQKSQVQAMIAASRPLT